MVQVNKVYLIICHIPSTLPFSSLPLLSKLIQQPKYANQIQIQIFHLVGFQIQIFVNLNTNTNMYLTPTLRSVYVQRSEHWDCETVRTVKQSWQISRCKGWRLKQSEPGIKLSPQGYNVFSLVDKLGGIHELSKIWPWRSTQSIPESTGNLSCPEWPGLCG